MQGRKEHDGREHCCSQPPGHGSDEDVDAGEFNAVALAERGAVAEVTLQGTAYLGRQVRQILVVDRLGGDLNPIAGSFPHSGDLVGPSHLGCRGRSGNRRGGIRSLRRPGAIAANQCGGPGNQPGKQP